MSEPTTFAARLFKVDMLISRFETFLEKRITSIIKNWIWSKKDLDMYLQEFHKKGFKTLIRIAQKLEEKYPKEMKEFYKKSQTQI